MPRISKKAKLLADLEKAILFEKLLANSDSSDDEDERDNSAVALEPLPPLAVNGEGDVDSDDDIDKFPCFSDELCDWYVKVLLSRTVFPGIVLKKPITLSTMIESMREDAFKHFFRMVPCSFIALLAIIKDDAIFQNSSNNPQREVALRRRLYVNDAVGDMCVKPIKTVVESDVVENARRIVLDQLGLGDANPCR